MTILRRSDRLGDLVEDRGSLPALDTSRGLQHHRVEADTRGRAALPNPLALSRGVGPRRLKRLRPRSAALPAAPRDPERVDG